MTARTSDSGDCKAFNFCTTAHALKRIKLDQRQAYPGVMSVRVRLHNIANRPQCQKNRQPRKSCGAQACSADTHSPLVLLCAYSYIALALSVAAAALALSSLLLAAAQDWA
eukprot:329898-Pelagomonas_calceolata.AAC.2